MTDTLIEISKSRRDSLYESDVYMASIMATLGVVSPKEALEAVKGMVREREDDLK